MSIRLDPWQQKVSDYEGDILLCTGRRVGKTYILARKAIDKMAREKNTPIVMVSLTEDQAMIIMSMALNYARETYPNLIGKGDNKPTLKSLHLNGGKMIVRPVGTSGDGARGFEGGVLIVDEADRMPRLFWIAAKPILLTTNGQIWMGSTPKPTKEGYFWDRYDEVVNKKNPEARFKVFCISSEEAMKNREISASWTEKQRDGALRVLAEDKREMSKKEYMQEYMGEFVDDLYAFFPIDLVEQAQKIKNREPCLEQGDNFLGADLAGMGSDETRLISVKVINRKKIRQIDMVKTVHTRTTQTTELIKFQDKKWNHRKLYIDNAGLGVGIFDSLLEDPQTKRKVVPIMNVKKNIDLEEGTKTIMKHDLYINLLRLLERGDLELFDDPEILISFQSITCTYEDGKMFLGGRYSHIVEALGRACWCIKDKSLKCYIY